MITFNRVAIAILIALALPCSAQQFKHIVFVVQENRTPDNLFGPCSIPGADLLAVGGPVPLGTTQDIVHTHSQFIAETAGTWPPLALNYVQTSDVQTYCDMGLEYSFANRMFQTNQGPSRPAHDFIFGGTSVPVYPGQLHDDWMMSENGGNCINVAMATFIDSTGSESHTGSGCSDHDTMADVLKAAGISWRYYAPTAGNIWTAPAGIRHLCQPSAGRCTGPDFTKNVSLSSALNSVPVLGDIQNGNLAQVSWVIPSGPNSDHPSYGSGGPAWVAAIVNAIGQSPYWQDTAILVFWDDWGGWYDHVPPPANTTGWCTSYCFGFRVPLLAVSAHTPAGYVSNQQMDFGSSLKFVEQNFNLPLIGDGTYADAYAQFDAGFFSGPARSFRRIKARKLTRAEIASKADPDND